MFEREISEFGLRMGLGDLALSPPEGRLALDVEGLGRLHLEVAERDEVLVYLAAPLAAHDHETLPRALARCHYDEGFAPQLYCGFEDGQLMLMSRLSASEITAPALERLAEALFRTMRELFSNLSGGPKCP
ncbi:type III secretion chaperone SycN [Deltaproteobacteria bacterium Smac51]|nr:type III secretion chaperone SycN [Deltaproteobacteria bacterium Smac51]